MQWEQQPPRASGEYSLINIDLEKNTCRGIDLRKTLGERVQDNAGRGNGRDRLRLAKPVRVLIEGARASNRAPAYWHLLVSELSGSYSR